MKKFLRSILESDIKLWVVFFLYPALAALFVQLILLPVIFPQWNAGEGLLAGGDWYGYHQLAVSLAEKIQAQGWSAWVLRPDGQAPSGIAAIFYVLISPHPWVLIPLYAGLHATAAFVLFKIILRFTQSRLISFISALPFWLYPSAMIWYTQIHKDGYLIAGALLVLLAWLRLAEAETWKRWQNILVSLVLLFGGAFLAWIVRPYSVQMMQGISLAIVVVESFLFVRRAWKRDWRPWQALTAVVIVWAAVVALTPLTVGGIEADLASQSVPTKTTYEVAPRSAILDLNGGLKVLEKAKILAGLGNGYQNLSEQQIAVSGSSGAKLAANNRLSECNPPPPTWYRSAWPDFVESKAYALAIVRERFRICFPGAASNIDVQVAFHDVNDILFYLPRATEIAFLSPFPLDWFKPGTLPANTVMRRVSGFEMVGVYIALALLLVTIWRWRRKPDLWIVCIFCTGMMLVYALVVANVGTLYRFRYGFIMTLVAVGIAGGLSAWEAWRQRVKV
jgi:hypothetical protein